ncbi:hypothetical protein [Natronococcus pandeyae]|uniref:hypothetical protein n=1 Tax=Natronococcus pandeyae TaxID=2055836 RepID=UPI0011E73348|nr:hypothetical protein [Natronococcus pandeyae]
MVVNRESKITIAVGLVAGATAWVVGYILTYAAAIGDVQASEDFESLEAATGEDLAVEMIGLLFFNAHNVPADAPQYSVLQALDPRHNFILAEGGSTLVLYAVPILVLLFAGAIVTRYTQTVRGSVTDAALTGSIVIVGYLPLVILGTFVFTVAPGEEAMAPNLLLSIGFAGTFYPLVFGAIGGVIAYFATRAPRNDSVSEPNST